MTAVVVLGLGGGRVLAMALVALIDGVAWAFDSTSLEVVRVAGWSAIGTAAVLAIAAVNHNRRDLP